MPYVVTGQENELFTSFEAIPPLKSASMFGYLITS